jgi:hypothetical protein
MFIFYYCLAYKLIEILIFKITLKIINNNLIVITLTTKHIFILIFRLNKIYFFYIMEKISVKFKIEFESFLFFKKG